MTQPINTALESFPDHPPSGSRVSGDRRQRAAEVDDVPTAAMGALELETYRKCWLASSRFRRHNTEVAAERERERAIGLAEKEARAAIEKAMRTGKGIPRSASRSGDPPSSRSSIEDVDDDQDDSLRRISDAERYPPNGGLVAARLLFSRIFDRRPALLDALRSGAPAILIDVGDALMLDRVAMVWRSILFESTTRFMDLARDPVKRREDLDALYLVVKEPPKSTSKISLDTTALSMLAFALPLIAISPLARSHLPEAVNAAATDRIDLPPLDATTIVRTIRVVTGKTCPQAIADGTLTHTSIADLDIAVRFDRTPQECLAELRRLNAAKIAKKKSRELTLSQLHGLGEAREWAEAAISDIEAWKRGEISWSAVPSGVALNGPAGCGKTTFAAVFAASAGLNFVSATLAKWQSSGEAHLGHLLRAMRQDFEAARARAPSCLFIDEIDSFPDRTGVTHSHRDYVIEVVNALLAEIDGIAGREGVVIIGASNDIGRCDPALLRAGRLERIVQIDLPDIPELEKMFRVRLGADLVDEDILPIAELAAGMTGADVERVVKDARRAARRDGGRSLVFDDLQRALVEDDDRPHELRWRSCVHEAAHILVDVIHFGPRNIFARVAKMQGRFGMSARRNSGYSSGTTEEYRKRLEVILAGRAAEELICGSASHGAGGAPGSDLDKATALACAMVGSFGLAGPTPLTYLGPARDAGTFLAFAEIRAAVNHELSEAASSCALLLKANRSVLKAIARRLAAHGRIDGAQVATLLAEAGRDGLPSGRGGAEP